MSDAVLVAIIASIPATIGAVSAMRTHREVKNPNGSTTGQAVEDIHVKLLAHIQTPDEFAHPPLPEDATSRRRKGAADD